MPRATAKTKAVVSSSGLIRLSPPLCSVTWNSLSGTATCKSCKAVGVLNVVSFTKSTADSRMGVPGVADQARSSHSKLMAQV